MFIAAAVFRVRNASQELSVGDQKKLEKMIAGSFSGFGFSRKFKSFLKIFIPGRWRVAILSKIFLCKFTCTPSKILKSTPQQRRPIRTYNFNLNIDENFPHDFRFDEIFSYYLFFRSGDIIVPFPFRASPNFFNLPSKHRLAVYVRKSEEKLSAIRWALSVSLFKHRRKEKLNH